MKKQKNIWNFIFRLTGLIAFWVLLYSFINFEDFNTGTLPPHLIVEVIFFILFLFLVLVL